MGGSAGNRHRPLAHLAATVRVANQSPGYWRQRRPPIRAIEPAPFVPNPKNWPEVGLFAAWLGHSTVLVKSDGFTFLTDPVLGDRCGVNVGPMTVGLKRMVAPALSAVQLPHIDLILLSHAHFDHLDRATLRALQNRDTQVVTASRTANLLHPSWFGNIAELQWAQSTRVGPASVRAFEVNHWGARIRTDTYRGYNGYLVETPNRRIVFGGDTALTDNFRVVRSSAPVDLAIMPIGAYSPWIHVHCTPEQALTMANDAGAEHILPVHHQTFRLGREPFFEPIERLKSALGAHSNRLALERIGQEWKLG